MFQWKKGGLILAASQLGPPALSHAQIPTALTLTDRRRVYFASRSADGKSYTAFVDLDCSDPTKVLRTRSLPVIGFGKPGTFDDDGLMPSYAFEHRGRVLLYYSGWNQRKTVPYHNSMGLAQSTDGGQTFERVFEGPIMDRSAEEPYLAVTPSLLVEDGFWRMWYVSGLRWEKVGERFEPIYVIKYAHSDDGQHWTRPNITCIPQLFDQEAFSRPWVLKIGRRFHMWYCCRASVDYRDGAGAYRLGYAVSEDGIAWQRRDDQAGLPPSESGWDSTMICYPCVVRAGKSLIMFYNGNGFGREGFGYATAELGDEDTQ